ncbi:MAG: glycosyltransferase family 4 protein [Candidatus Omnitrophica bacterium]|nr:glycosyltransferase family 4 protein [Candidatus Omnitrophota bacterium]
MPIKTNGRKINVCILSPGLPVPPAKGGAIETLIDETARRYKASAARVFFEETDAGPSSRGADGALDSRPVRVSAAQRSLQRFLNRPARRGLFFLYDSFFIRQVLREIDFEPDIFHIHNNFYYLPRLKSHFPRARFVLHMHNDFLFEHARLHRRYRRVLEDVDKLIAVSGYVARRILDHDAVCRPKVIVIPNGVSPTRFRKLPPDDPALEEWRGRLGLGREDRVILFVGRIHPIKGVDVLLRAFGDLRRGPGRLRLLIAGSSWFAEGRTTPYLEKLRRLSRPMGESVIFTGFVPHERLNYLYNLAELCVVPSVCQDPFVLVNVEAMAAGCAVIASATGGIPEVVTHRQTGILVPPGDADSLCRNMRFLLDHEADRLDLVRRASQVVKDRYSWSLVAERYEAVYRELVG